MFIININYFGKTQINRQFKEFPRYTFGNTRSDSSSRVPSRCRDSFKEIPGISSIHYANFQTNYDK
jgi:hypothetical protein